MKLSEIFLSEQDLLEMTNLVQSRTGVRTVIWVGPTDGTHSKLRIKVSNNPGKMIQSDCFVVSISKDPEILEGQSKLSRKILQEVFDWVKLNYEQLLKLAASYEKDASEEGADSVAIINTFQKLN